MLKPYHNIEQAIEMLYLKGIEIPPPLAISEIGRALSVITSQFINSEKVNLRLLGYCSRLLRQFPFNVKENTSIADLCERAWTIGDVQILSKTISKLWGVWYKSIEYSDITFVKKNVKISCHYDNWKTKYQSDEFRSVKEFCDIVKKDLEPFLVDAQIHGSLSDMKLSKYSDLDVLLIIKSDVVTDATALIDLRDEVLKLLRCIREFDALQHHTLFILTEQEMACYAESRFPLLLMDYATSILDKPLLYFNTIEDKMQSAASLYSMAKRVSVIDKISSENYNLKMYSSWLMLLPTMYYQLFNRYVYKADSFDLVKNEFDSYSWGAVEACSELREIWDDEEANDLSLLGIEPEIIEKAKKFSLKILEDLDKEKINDLLWDQIDLTKQSKHYAVTYHPIYYSLKEFADVESQWAIKISQIDGVHSVYSFGTNNPTCGISDLDLLIVLDDEFNNEIALKIKKLRESLQVGMAGYIKWHEEIIVEQSDLEYHANLWEPAPRFLLGKEDLVKVIEYDNRRSDFRKVLLFKEGFFQFLKMLEFFYTPSVPLRLVLLRCNSIKYDIDIAKEELEVDHPLSEKFKDNIKALRDNWFALDHDQRLTICRTVLIDSLRILHFLLSKCCEEEIIQESLSMFRGSKPEIDLGFIKIHFQKDNFKYDDPKNINIANKEVTFPIAFYPLIELCQINIKTSSEFNLHDLSKSIKPGLREIILPFQEIWAKGIEFETQINK